MRWPQRPKQHSLGMSILRPAPVDSGVSTMSVVPLPYSGQITTRTDRNPHSAFRGLEALDCVRSQFLDHPLNKYMNIKLFTCLLLARMSCQ